MPEELMTNIKKLNIKEPFGGTTPAQDKKIDSCVQQRLKDPNFRKGQKPETRKSSAIAICKSAILGKESLQENWKEFSFDIKIKEDFGSELGVHPDGTSLDSDFRITGTAINETTTRNGITYTSEELVKAARSLIGKPILKDHNNSVDSIVGIVEDSNFSFGESKLMFKGRIVDDKAQKLIHNGLINKVSVGAKVEDLDESEPGKIIAKGIEFLELSLVAVPGDPNASIDRSFAIAISESYDMKKQNIEEETNMESDIIQEAEHPCPECKKMFDSKSKLDKHMTDKHQEEEKMAETQDNSEDLKKQIEALTAELKAIKESEELKKKESEAKAAEESFNKKVEEEVQKKLQEKEESKSKGLIKESDDEEEKEDDVVEEKLDNGSIGIYRMPKVNN